jgi:hypothetical protein
MEFFKDGIALWLLGSLIEVTQNLCFAALLLTEKSPEDVIVPKYSPRYGQLTQTTTSIHFLTILSIVLLT